MIIDVKRYQKTADGNATIGRLYVETDYECFTLELPVREVAGQPIAQWKIPGATAIGQGVFPLTLDYSPHFGCWLPHVNDTPGFTGVMLHWGNRPADTEACILCGQTHPEGVDFIGSSRLAIAALMRKIEAAIGWIPTFDANGNVQSYDTLKSTHAGVVIRVSNNFDGPN